MGRASGKTTLLIKESARTGRPIIEPNTASARYVEERARKMGFKSLNRLVLQVGIVDTIEEVILTELMNF